MTIKPTVTGGDAEQLPQTAEFQTIHVESGAATLLSRDIGAGEQELILVRPESQTTIIVSYSAKGNRIQDIRPVDNYTETIIRLRREMGTDEYFVNVEPLRD